MSEDYPGKQERPRLSGIARAMRDLSEEDLKQAEQYRANVGTELRVGINFTVTPRPEEEIVD